MDVTIVATLTFEQEQDVSYLQKLVFRNVSDNEVEKDFYHKESAHVLGYIGNQLVGWAGLHKTEQLFEGKTIKIGGYGICTHPDFQQKGVATIISRDAIKYLKEHGCDIGFLSVDPTNIASVRLHQKNGFILLPRNYIWTNSEGVLKEDNGAMISPINSHELFEYVLNGTEVLYVGNGYW